MTKGKILIIDDTKIVCLGLEAEFSDIGFEAESAYSGKDAVQKVKEKFYDLVFTDLIMPEMDGVETCRAIKKISPKTEVILMSGHPQEVEQKKEQFIAAGGMDMFLRKPFQEGEITEVAVNVLARKNSTGGGEK